MSNAIQLQEVETKSSVQKSEAPSDFNPASEDALMCAFFVLLKMAKLQKETQEGFVASIQTCIKAQQEANERLDAVNLEVPEDFEEKVEQTAQWLWNQIPDQVRKMLSYETIKGKIRDNMKQDWQREVQELEIRNEQKNKIRSSLSSIITMDQQWEQIGFANSQSETSASAQTMSVEAALMDILKTVTEKLCTITQG